MISIGLFREYVRLVEKKIEEIVSKCVQFRPVAQELRNKAIEIENYTGSYEEPEDEIEANPRIIEEQEEQDNQELELAESSPSGSLASNDRSNRRTVENRRSRVSRKIVHVVSRCLSI